MRLTACTLRCACAETALEVRIAQQTLDLPQHIALIRRIAQQARLSVAHRIDRAPVASRNRRHAGPHRSHEPAG